MSGIYGMVRYDGAPVTKEMLAPMAAAMSFRGPDGHGQWCGDSAGLGHLMLHVTPESLHERLPASLRAAPHLIITADARIDNRDELFDALGVPGPGRAQTPDSSLILLAYERWGADCVKRLLGDFAFAIWDSRERRLFCARDPFGCKPFVYHHDGKRFVFASDVKGVLARVESPRLNEPLLAAYLQMRTPWAERKLTFFLEAVKLPPAHTLTLTAQALQVAQYWSPEDAADVRLASDADYAEQLRILFQESVRSRLRSNFPVGSHLSGGMDSSAVSIAAWRDLRAGNRPMPVFSWVPPPAPGIDPDPDSEHHRIAAVCRQEGLVCQYLPPTVESYLEVLRRDITVEPVEMMEFEAGVQTAAESQGVRVILSGFGGDEVVSIHTECYLAEFFMKGEWSAYRGAARRRLTAAGPGLSPMKLRKLAGIAYTTLSPRLPDWVYFRFIQKRAYGAFRTSYIHPAFARRYRREVQELRGCAWRDLPTVRTSAIRRLSRGHLQKRTEPWAASGAAHRLEYRYPMLDRRLVEFVLGVPAAQFCGPERSRSLFRRAVDGLLPRQCDWTSAKRSPDVLNSMRPAYYTAALNWAKQNLVDQLSVPTAVDPAKMRATLGSRDAAGGPPDLNGIGEAMSCWAIDRKYLAWSA